MNMRIIHGLEVLLQLYFFQKKNFEMYIIYRIKKYLTIGAAPATGQIQPFDSNFSEWILFQKHATHPDEFRIYSSLDHVFNNWRGQFQLLQL